MNDPWGIENKIEKIIDSNVEAIPYEGDDVDKTSMKEQLFEFFQETMDENAMEFGLWLGNNLKQTKGKKIDELYNEFKNL